MGVAAGAAVGFGGFTTTGVILVLFILLRAKKSLSVWEDG
jgi:hypothetical protein